MTARKQRTSFRFWRAALVACFVLSVVAPLLTLAPRDAGAVGINVIYDGTIKGAIDPCKLKIEQACPDGVSRTPEMLFLAQVAAAYWSVIFHDAHNLTIRVAWVAGEDPFTRVEQVDAQGRPKLADILVRADYNWFYDPTPFDDEEFEMTPKLFRDTHPAERVEAFDGDVPEIFEVGYNGVGPGADLLTMLLHEVGHAIGLHPDIINNRPVVPCDPDGDRHYWVDPALTGGASVGIKGFEQYKDFPITLGQNAGASESGEDRQLAGNHDKQLVLADCAHLAAGGIKECGKDNACKRHQALMWPGMVPGARSRPSVTDILAIATAAGWQEVHLPRKYSLGSGLWLDDATWLGGRQPNAGNNVYIVNRETDTDITLYGKGQAREVLVSEGNSLNVTFGTLDVYRLDATGADTIVTVDTGALLDAVYVDIGPGATLDIAGAEADIFWTLVNNGTVRGGAARIELRGLDNKGTIRSNGGTLEIVSLSANPALDVDGSNWSITRVLEATTGDLIFDGPLTDAVGAAIRVGNGYAISFTEGWTQEFTGVQSTALTFQGQGTVHGATTLGGYVDPDGSGRFTDATTFGNTSHTLIALGGLMPGAEHDELIFDGEVSFAGALDLSLANGFMPAPNDSFVIARYAAHSGAYTTVTGWELPNFKRLELEYDATELRVVARLAGDMNGDGQWTNADIGLLTQSFGPCAPDPIPCRGDMDKDGDIDHDDLQILIRLINAS